MKPERWQEVERLYYATLDKMPDDRAAFLDSATTDESLRGEIRSLLAAGASIGDFLEPPVEATAEVPTTVSEPLMIGAELGAYRILSLLGKGGMGEVCLALDTRLNRKVAIKLLPAKFTLDAERVRRFEQEVRAASALNHPNIITVYEIDTIERRRYIVTEYIEGETVRQRMLATHGRIRLSEALEIAAQVAIALQAAHEVGITHRDIKPENVMVRKDGLVKVLDFGLAKLTRANTASQSSSIDDDSSVSGILIGTASYMSPEQARGEKVDHRTDIFSLGVMLYEMVSGHRPFGGATWSDTIAAILTKDPEPLAQMFPEVPASLQRLVNRCLEKQVGKRFQSAGDLSFALQELSEPAVPATAPRPQGNLRWIASMVALATVIVMLGIPAVRYLLETPPPEMRVDIATRATSDPISLALSPDGRQIVFAAATASGDGQSQLWIRALDKATAEPLAGTEGGSNPFWSPDSRSIGFFDGAKLKKVGLAGGWPQTLSDAAARGGTWNSDDIILFGRNLGTGPLFRIRASGGEPVAVTKLDKQTSHGFPHFLPDARHFLFYSTGSPETGGIYLGSLDEPDTKRLTDSDSAGVFHPAGWLLFERAGTLFAARLDLTKRALIGDPIKVADAVAFDGRTHGSALSVSANGLVAYRTGGANLRQLVWFDRFGKALGRMGAPDASLLAPRLSPDGLRAAVSLTTQGNTDIWLLDEARRMRFTFDAGLDRFPIWSPDGSQVVFDSNRSGVRNLYRKPSNGSGSEELLIESPQHKTAYDWSPDGNFILYGSVDPQTKYDLWILPLADRMPFAFLKTNLEERRGQFSPNGHWVVYLSNDSGVFQVCVRPFPGPGRQIQISTSGGAQPHWGPDGKEIYYIAPDGILMSVPLVIKDGKLNPGTPLALFQTHIVGGADVTAGTNYDVAPDGHFLINTVVDDSPSPIVLLQNWTPTPR